MRKSAAQRWTSLFETNEFWRFDNNNKAKIEGTESIWALFSFCQNCDGLYRHLVKSIKSSQLEKRGHEVTEQTYKVCIFKHFLIYRLLSLLFRVHWMKRGNIRKTRLCRWVVERSFSAVHENMVGRLPVTDWLTRWNVYTGWSVHMCWLACLDVLINTPNVQNNRSGSHAGAEAWPGFKWWCGLLVSFTMSLMCNFKCQGTINHLDLL